MSITHLIFTRFNIQYEENETTGIRPEWLENRLVLFEKYCLPSIQKQTCQDFIWILVGSSNTSEEYKSRINNYHSIVPQIRTYWVEFQDDAYHSFYRQLAHEFAKEKDVLISTRLDNDDALSIDYVEKVQELAKNGVRGIVSFSTGRQTFYPDNKSYKILYKQNHFTSRIEINGYETIMVLDHTQVPLSSLHIVETLNPMWEEMVHGNNIANGYQPKYHYVIRNIYDALDLFVRWFVFQFNRIIRFGNTLFISFHKV